jgi:hypothetical protein
MANNELYVFVASEKSNVGIYINVITHAVNYLGMTSIKFIKLTNNETLQDFDISHFIRYDVNNKLRDLSAAVPDTYQRAFDVFSSNKQEAVWDYLLLKKSIRDSAAANIFYDLTSLPKAVCIDVFVKLISCDVENILNFECKNTVAAKKEYHELTESDFRVVRLVDEDSFVYTVRRYARQQNQGKVVVVFCCTILGIIALQFLPIETPSNWVLTFFALVSGAIPFAELLGLLNISAVAKKIARRKTER